MPVVNGKEYPYTKKGKADAAAAAAKAAQDAKRAASLTALGKQLKKLETLKKNPAVAKKATKPKPKPMSAMKAKTLKKKYL